MSLDIFLLSMQAAGAIADTMGTRSEIRMGRIGAQLEQAQVSTRIEEERLASSQRAVDAMVNLRQTLATSRAISAARGVDVGAGTAFMAQAGAVAQATADERIRRMNLLSRESMLRSTGTLSGLHQLKSETQLGRQLSRRMFEGLPISESVRKLGFGFEEKL